MAHEVLLQTGKLPINFDQTCLSHQSGGRDTGIIMKMFKTACLSYEPTDVEYREHKLSRLTLIGMRRELVDKMAYIIQGCEMFGENSAMPRRHFDDLVLEKNMESTKMKNEAYLTG